MPLSDLRRQIDEIDSRLLELLSERARLAQEVGRGKTDQLYYRPERERQIYERLNGLNEGPFPAQAIRAIFGEIISASRALEAPISVAYLGPPGTFSHRAALDKFGTSSHPKPADTIPDVFASVERGEADYGVVPVENSTEGIVTPSLDMFVQTPLKVCAEVFVPVHHNLATRAASLGEVKRLYANPQAYAQSRGRLSQYLPKVEVVDVTSNAKAAQMAAVDSESAAICPDICAEVYKIPIVASHIEDSPHNRTRFLVIGRNEPNPSGKDKTSIFFSVRHKAGALLRAMEALDHEGLNLTMIESRPTKQMPWEYVFFIDFQGHVRDEKIARALTRLEEHSLFVTILGSYPEAD